MRETGTRGRRWEDGAGQYTVYRKSAAHVILSAARYMLPFTYGPRSLSDGAGLEIGTTAMKILTLPSAFRTLAALTVMVAESAGAAPILSDPVRSLDEIICGLYMAKSTCRQSFDGGDRGGQSQLWPMSVLEESDRVDEIFSAGRSVPRGFGANSASFGQYVTAGNDNKLFSPMSLNGGHDAMVAFRGDDDSILIGHYRSGPWSKFLRGWNDGRGAGGEGAPFPPIVESSSGLPEPSTLALLGLGLLGFGVLRQKTKS